MSTLPGQHVNCYTSHAPHPLKKHPFSFQKKKKKGKGVGQGFLWCSEHQRSPWVACFQGVRSLNLATFQCFTWFKTRNLVEARCSKWKIPSNKIVQSDSLSFIWSCLDIRALIVKSQFRPKIVTCLVNSEFGQVILS